MASDGYRVALATFPADAPKALEGILPLALCKELIQLARFADDGLVIEWQEPTPPDVKPAYDGGVRVRLGQVEVFAYLVPSKYPDVFGYVIKPAVPVWSVRVDAADLSDAVTYLEKYAQGTSDDFRTAEGRLPIRFLFEGNNLRVAVEHGRQRASVDVAVSDVQGEPTRIALNVDYIKDALRSFSGPFTFECRQLSIGPIVFLTQSDITHAVMPIVIKDWL